MFSRIALVLAAILAVVPVAARSDEAPATLSGTVETSSGAPVAGAQISVNGPGRAQTASDASGHFTLSLIAGIYRVDVNKGGFVPSSIDEVVLARGAAQTLSVVLTQADLTTLRTIGRVSVSRRNSINSGAASTNYVDTDMLRNAAYPQISQIVQNIPGAAIQRGSSNPNVEISLAGSQPYETQTLIDGHPIATGRVGTFYAQFLNQYTISGIETQLGPGNTTPFAGTAVGGTANIITPGYTAKPAMSFLQGVDTTGTLYSNFLTSGTFGRVSYVLDGAVGGYNGPFAGRGGCVLSPLDKSTWNTSSSTGVLSFCGPISSSLQSKGEVAKLRYALSNTTSIEAGFVGTQSGYFPQNITYGVDAGPVPITGCITVGAGLSQCTSPYAQQFVGKATQSYFYYPGSMVYYQMPLFEAQLRTAIGDNTLLVRPYAGSITRNIDGSGEANYPAFWYPASEGAAGAAYCAKQEAPANSVYHYNPVGQTVNGLTECLQSPYSTYEHDTLHGTTVSFIHPMGQNDVTFTYDYHSDSSFSNVGNFAGTPQVPAGTIAKFNLFSATGDFALRENLSMKTGLYLNNWHLNGTTTVGQTSNGSGGVMAISGPLSTSVTRFDPHVAFTWQPKGDTSYRLALGTSTTFPYALLVSGTTSVLNPSGTGSQYPSLIQKNPALAPERAAEFDLGGDHRFRSGGIVTLDLLNTNISNVFETLSTLTATPGGLFPFENVSQPINAANLSNKIAIVGYKFQPLRGLGYFANATFARSVVNGIPLSFYGATPGVPANGVQQCLDGSGNTVCVPYFKAYANANYTFDGSYVGVGVDFEGKNNTYSQPPFAIYDFTARHAINAKLDGQLSIFNLLNTNAFGYVPRPNAGVGQVGETNTGAYGSFKSTSLPYPLIPVQPRTAYFQLRLHVGGNP